jgi:Kef-type K+ transport system membrane component KefB
MFDAINCFLLAPVSGIPVLLAAGQEATLRMLLLQLIVIILAARLGAAVARWLGQPSVVGEIVAGLLLGPSALGAVAPRLSAAIFGGGVDPAEGGTAGLDATLTGLSQIGLVLLLFLIGLEFDFSHIRRQGRLAAAISLAGIVAPFALGVGLAMLMMPRLAVLGGADRIDPLSFALFLGTAMSITAIPILGRILIEMGMQHTLIGATVIAAAACDDAVGWTLLAAVSAIAVGRFDPWSVVQMIGSTLLFAAFTLFVVRPWVLPWLERACDHDTGPATHPDHDTDARKNSPEAPHQASPTTARLSPAALSLLLAALFAAAVVTSLIGIFAIFGAFLLGASLSGSPRLREAVAAHLTDFVTVFFLPIFFTYTGLRTNIGTLDSPEAWGWCAAVMAVAVLGKWGGCGLAARVCGMPPREAACVGVLMNTRALMELIVCNVGTDLGVIPPAVSCMLVLMAIGTTLMATPLAARMLRGTSHEQRLIDRGFLRA